MATEKKVIDWEAIERDYRAGILSLREIAAAHGCSHVAISKRARAEAWARDLAAKIQAKADALVNREAVTTAVTKQRRVNDVEVIEANAQGQALVRIGQRQDIRRFRALVNRLLDECEATTADAPAFGELADLVRKSDGNPRANAMLAGAIDRAVSLGDRIDGVKKLSEALRILIGLEREAYGIEAGMGSGSPLDAMGNWLKSAQGASIPVMPLAIEIGD